jgi:rare lipoprotein A
MNPWRARVVGSVAVCLAAALAGCASRAPGPRPGDDGPEERPPPNLMQVPDALPRLEPIRDGGPNKPYEVFGQAYAPLRPQARYAEDGLASWYGRKFHGRPTASGEVYDMYAMTAAHKTLPLPSYARVTNPANGRSVIVRVNDRGPFVRGRIIDLSYTAALKLGTLGGVVAVQVERITPEQIASGAWRGAPAPVAPATAVPVIDGDGGPPEPAAPADPPAPTLPATAASPYTPRTEPPRAAAETGRGFWVQLGAYRDRAGALQLQQQAADRVEGLAPLLSLASDATLHRLQAGPFATREEAQRTADRVRTQLLLTPLVVERR